MERKQWNAVLDRFLTDGGMEIEEWEKIKIEGTETQNLILKELMNSFNRLNKREVLEIHHSLIKDETN